MIAFRIFFVMLIESLHILIAIIKLSGLSGIYLYLYSVEGVGPRHIRPIKTLGPSILIVFPTFLSMYIFAYHLR